MAKKCVVLYVLGPEKYDVRIEAQDMTTFATITGASAYADGNYAGATPVSVKLDAGAHIFRVEKSGYQTAERTVTVTGTITVVVGMYPAVPPGVVRISFCTYDKNTGGPVAGALVYVDGSYKGATNSVGAMTIDNVSTGSHVFKVTKSGYRDWQETITLPPLGGGTRENRGTYWWIPGTDYHTINALLEPTAAADSINYIEYWVGGKKVTTVKKGNQLEVRVVFTVASSGGTIRLAIQRVPGGAVVSSSNFTRIPGTYYLGWSWTVEYTGSYTIKVDLFNDSTLVESKSFPHTVTA